MVDDDAGPDIFARIYDAALSHEARVARLVELLRSDEAIPRGTRRLLADLFDPASKSRFFVELKERRGKGRPVDGGRKIGHGVRDANILGALIVRLESGQPPKAAAMDLVEEFGVSRTHIYDLMKKYDARLPSSSKKMD